MLLRKKKGTVKQREITRKLSSGASYEIICFIHAKNFRAISGILLLSKIYKYGSIFILSSTLFIRKKQILLVIQ